MTAVTWWFAVSQLLGHGDLHEQIQKLTEQIGRDSTNAILYHKRGELHRAHGEYADALADYAQAEKIDAGLDVLFLSRGRALLEDQKFSASLDALNTFLIRHPDHVEARWLRGRAFARLERHEEAERDFFQVLSSAVEISPDQIIERAKNLEKAGRNDAALAAIEDGIKRLGSLITLEMAALDLELALKRYNAALNRLDRLVDNAERKETFLVRKGEICDLMGDKRQAQRCYTLALHAIDALPDIQRKLKSTAKLEQDVRSRLLVNEKVQ